MLSAVQLVVMVMLTVNCYGSVSADDLSRYFADKVEQIRSTTSSSTPPTAEKDVNSCQVHSTVRDWLLTVAHYDFVEVSPLAQ